MGRPGFMNGLRKAVILLLIAAFASAQQGYAGTVIISDEPLELEKMLVEVPSLIGAEASAFHPAVTDTLETIDIEVEEDKGINYKEIAAYVIIAGAVAYVLYTLLKPDDEEEETEENGKPTPKTRIALQMSLSRL
jgi:hypothetical protein